MKIGVIVDNLTVSRWQANALASLHDCRELVVYNCTNPAPSSKRLINALYYLLNLFTIRNRLTQQVSLPPNLAVAKIVSYHAEREGNWQRLPPHLLREISEDAPSVILKFGAGLLRIPDAAALGVPILSYHHGDPEHFRGRPAGFYELLEDRSRMGQVVQILSNKLDSGKVVAFAETKVIRHSYRATLIEAYRHSPLLLNQALRNALSGKVIPKQPTGKNYRLPSNQRVAEFCFRILGRSIARALYGAFLEKKWQVAFAPIAIDPFVRSRGAAFPGDASWSPVELPNGYSFLADPFFHGSNEALLVEALRRSTNKGEILHILGDTAVRLSDPAHHHSYPGGLSESGIHYVVPETADWGSGQIFRIRGGRFEQAGELGVPGKPRLLDPTLYRSSDTVFLFANIDMEGSSVLRLWFSDTLFGDFKEHPCSPVRISPEGSRMGGEIARAGPLLVRVGQDLTRAYGDGLIFFVIEKLTRAEYRERQLFRFSLKDRKGPHTINFRGKQAVFDWYTDRFSLLAGVRRLNQARLPAKR